MITESDPRGLKAVALATDAGQWLKCRTRDGRKAYGVPSSEPGHYYLTTRETCTCKAWEYKHTCKHTLAVELHCQLVAEQAPKVSSSSPELARILGRPRHGVIPAHLIERED